jgi:hypothetical protein
VTELFAANGPAGSAAHRGGLLAAGGVELHGIARPALLVGAVDSRRPLAEATELLAGAIPSARVEWVEGGHLIDPAHPAVLAFVGEVLARG